jgi:hypothetical protein
MWIATVVLALAGLALEPTPQDDPLAPSPWTSGGELGVETRAFRNDDDPVTKDQGIGMVGRLELRYDRAWFDFKLRGSGRMDALDRDRTRLIPEEAWLQAKGERLRVRLGLDILNWSATEAFHPADVINARNLDSDLESFEKIGEPLLAFKLLLPGETSVDLFLMPAYTQTRFPSPRSRLNFAPAGVDLRRRARLLDRSGHLTDSDFGPQAALQIRKVLGSADVAVHVVEHMDRLQPSVVITPEPPDFALVYQTVRQAGGTYQQVLGPVIAKLEAAYRWFVPPDPAATATFGSLGGRNHGVVAIGLEYGVSHASGAQSTLLLEGQTILGPGREVRRGLDPFQRDLLAGYRFARNDDASRELLVFTVIDLERPGERLLNVAYQQRLGDAWSVKLGLRVFAAGETTPLEARGLAPLRNGDHVRCTLIRSF